jgi:outer membrane receptor protein involved in Fe transport
MVLAVSAGVSGQTITADLRGTVTDVTRGVLPDATVVAVGPTGEHQTVSDTRGFFRFSLLAPGLYRVTVSQVGFQPAVRQVTLPLHRTITLDVQLNFSETEEITVRANAPSVDRSRSSLSSVISPETIDLIPVNTRNYLDLIRLTPGVVENSRAGATAQTSLDTTGAILGERAGNISFLTDGLWNNNAFSGGVLQNLTQDTVEQFEVIAAGYAAEFGQGSGGVVNVITKSGTNQVSGNGFGFFRNDALDASNVDGDDPPELARANVGATVGGPIVENRDWFFASFEHVSEDRQALFPQDVPAVLAAQEDFTSQPESRDHRYFGKYTRRLGSDNQLSVLGSLGQLDRRNQLVSGTALPSAGQDTDNTTFLTSTKFVRPLSSRSLFEVQVGARGQSLDARGAAGESRSFSAFFLDTGDSFLFGPPIGSVRSLDQRYYTGRGTLTWFTGAAHAFKAGAEYTRTSVDGQNAPGLTHVLLTTTGSYAQYGNDGFQIPQGVGFATTEDAMTRFRNDGAAIFIQDDWQLRSDVTVNLGVRYEVDSVFNDRDNIAPRLGVAWVADDKTVVRGSWGVFYDRYRLGIADAVPALGGFNGRRPAPADVRTVV